MPWEVIIVVISTTAFYIGFVNCDCERLPDVPYTTNNATHLGKYREGAVLVFKCNENLSSLDNPFYICKNGTFKGLFSCTKCNCNLPQISNNHILLYHKNCHISYACALGYVCHGQASLFCRPDGRWSPNQPPECRPVSCGAHGNIENGKVVFESKLNATLFGTYGNIECNDGFLLDGEKHVSCQADGTWSARGTCKSFICPKYPGIQSKCVEKTQIHSKNYYIKCREDVPTADVGETTVPLKCQENGKWLNESRSCLCHCNVSELVNDKNIVVYGLENEHFLQHGYTFNWTCRNEARRGVNKTALCFDGRFNENLICESKLEQNVIHDYVIGIVCGIVLVTTSVVVVVVVCIVRRRKRAQTKGKGYTTCSRTICGGREKRKTKHINKEERELCLGKEQTPQSRDDSDVTDDRPKSASRDNESVMCINNSIETNVDTGKLEGSKQPLPHQPIVRITAEEDKLSEVCDKTVDDSCKKVIAKGKNTNDGSTAGILQQTKACKSGGQTEKDNIKEKEHQTIKVATEINMEGNKEASNPVHNTKNSGNRKATALPVEIHPDGKQTESDNSFKARETAV